MVKQIAKRPLAGGGPFYKNGGGAFNK